ncbi:hypothetical protein ABPG72_002894 [Tetrahymena utriculariae]
MQMEYEKYQIHLSNCLNIKNNIVQNNLQMKSDKQIDVLQINDPSYHHAIQYDQFKSYQNQSDRLTQTQNRLEESAQCYGNDNSWDQLSECSALKQTSQTQITSLSSSLDTQSQKYSQQTQNLQENDFEISKQKEKTNIDAQRVTLRNDQIVNTDIFTWKQKFSFNEQIIQRTDKTANILQKNDQSKQQDNDDIIENQVNSDDNSRQSSTPNQDNLQVACFKVISFNYQDMLGESLYCDIPFSLDSFIQEDEGNKRFKRLCTYNYFKKVTDIKTFRNGTMIDCSLASYSNCSFNHNYLINLLESKGSQRLHELAQSIQIYYDKIQNVIIDAQDVKLNFSPEFLQKRSQASMEEKQRILLEKDPRKNFYFKTYQVDWENFGSPRVAYYGFSKGFCEVVGLSIQEKKQQILRNGLLEYFLYHEKIRTLFKTCLTLPWSIPKDPIIIKGKQKFFTFDNIIISNASFSVEFHNLSYDFDQKNNFKSQLSDFMIVYNLHLDKAQESKINQQRSSRGKRLPDEKNDDEVDFYYSKDSQSFLEKYYKDVYGERISSKKPLRRCDYVDIFF